MIRELIDQHLLNEEEKNRHRQHSGKWNPSNFGRCYRFQYWNRKNMPASDPLTADTLRTFAIGKMLHQWVQGIIGSKLMCIIEGDIDERDCCAYVDIETQDEIIEIKSVRSYAFRKMIQGLKKGTYDFGHEKYGNILQVTFYAMCRDKKKCRLYFIDKDSMQDYEYVFYTAERVGDVCDELSMLNYYWNNNKLPPKDPKAFGGKECNYCKYRTKCKELEGEQNELVAAGEIESSTRPF